MATSYINVDLNYKKSELALSKVKTLEDKLAGLQKSEIDSIESVNLEILNQVLF